MCWLSICFFCCFFFVSCFFSHFGGGDFYKCMFLTAMFTFLHTPFYFLGIVLPQILQPCLLDACFLSLAPLSSIITLLPRVKVKKLHLLLNARVREFLCLQENKTTKTQCSSGILYRLQKNRRPSCWYLLLLSPTTP